MKPSLAIVIVNWNSGGLLRDCLASIDRSALDACSSVEVVVVDNDSTDGSQDALRLDGPRLRLIRNDTNRGFAAACNQGASVVRCDFLLFLNPDTRLFTDSVAKAIHFLSSPGQSDVGILGIQLVDEQGRIARCAARFPRPLHFAAQCLGIDRLWPATGHLMREWDHGVTRRVDQVIGAFFLVRRQVYDELGGFDERFFVYFEEVDFALRARRAGWASVFLAEAQAFHLGGGATRNVKAMRLFFSLRSRLQYGAKHFRRTDRWALALVTWILEPLSRAGHALLRGEVAEARDVAAAYRLLARDRSRFDKSKARLA